MIQFDDHICSDGWFNHQLVHSLSQWFVCQCGDNELKKWPDLRKKEGGKGDDTVPLSGALTSNTSRRRWACLNIFGGPRLLGFLQIRTTCKWLVSLMSRHPHNLAWADKPGWWRMIGRLFWHVFLGELSKGHFLCIMPLDVFCWSRIDSCIWSDLHITKRMDHSNFRCPWSVVCSGGRFHRALMYKFGKFKPREALRLLAK